MDNSLSNSARHFHLSDDTVSRLRARDESAYKDLVERAFNPLARYAYSFVQSFDVAKDIAQGVLVWIWFNCETLDTRGVSLAAYLYKAVRYKALNVLRENATQTRYADALQEETMDNHTSLHAEPGERANPEAPLSSLEHMLGALTEKQRTAVTLRYGHELKLEEVAGVLGISVKNTRVILDRAIARMRSVFAK
jgi:RNA polymerase sigma factor (sigma-70 family)